MANRRLLSDIMPNYPRSLRKVLGICSKNPSVSLTSFGGGRLPSSIQSPEPLFPHLRALTEPPFLRSLSLCSKSLLGKSATFSPPRRYFSTVPAATVSEEAVVAGRRESPSRSSSPYLMIPPGLVAPDGDDEVNGRDCYRLYSLADKKVKKIDNKNLRVQYKRDILLPADKDDRCVGYSHGLLAFINRNSGALYLFNPFIDTEDSVYLPFFSLPPIETLPSIMSSLRSRKSTTHGDGSSSSSIVTEYMCPSRISTVSSKDLNENIINKIVLSSCPYTNNPQDCTVMAIQGYGWQSERLAFCKPGDKAWTPLVGMPTSYVDLVYFSKDQKFYAMTFNGMVEAWDLRDPASPNSTRVKSASPPTVRPTMDERQRALRIESQTRMCLVESSGDLLIVVRYISEHVDPPRFTYRTFLFDVYKLDFVQNKWVYVPNLGDRVLFVGLNQSVSLSARDFPGLRENSIYFGPCTSKYYWENTWGVNELGVFNLEDGTITPFYGCDFEKIQPPVWIIPPI